MADNTILPLGTEDGDTYASDDISGVKFQRVKVTLGADGVNSGDVSASNPLPISDNGGSLTVDGPLTDTELRADSIDVNIAADNSGGIEIYPSSGFNFPVTNGLTQFAVNIPPPDGVTIDGAGTVAKAEDSASASVDAGIPAMAIRKATPANTSNTDGDYEMLQMSAGRLWVDPSGVTLTVGSHAVTNAGVFAAQAAITAASGSISSGAISSGALASGSVASGALASGSIADGASVTLGAKADAKSTATDTTAVTAMSVLKQISASVQAPPSQAVTNAGTFVAQIDGAALTSLQLADDVVYTDDTSTHATGTSKGTLFMAAAAPTDTSVNANDIGAVAMTTDRKLHVSVQDALPAGSAAIGKLAANDGVDIGDVTLTAGSAAIGKLAANAGVTIGAVEIAAAQTLSTITTVGTVSTVTNVVHVDDNSSSLTVDGSVSLIPLTTGGLTTYHLIAAGTTNAASVKGSAGQLYGWYIYNQATSMRKVAFHNTSGTPTAGASIFFSIPIPASSGANVFSDVGITFSSGIGITTTTGIADADSAAVTASDLAINLFYK